MEQQGPDASQNEYGWMQLIRIEIVASLTVRWP